MLSALAAIRMQTIKMDTNQEFKDKLNKLILHWRSQGIKLNTGISIDNIRNLEIDFGLQFEEAFSNYLTSVNGFVDFESDEAWFSFWSQARMREENEDGSHPKEIMWFSDHSINLCSFGFHKTDKKIYTHYQTIGGVEFIANSFTEFVDLYLEDAYLLLR